MYISKTAKLSKQCLFQLTLSASRSFTCASRAATSAILACSLACASSAVTCLLASITAASASFRATLARFCERIQSQECRKISGTCKTLDVWNINIPLLLRRV